MGQVLTETPSLMLAALLATAMIAACLAGWRSSRRRTGPGEGSGDKFTDASMAVLGLLLAFTFGMSLDKHNQRRLMVVADANAIGDFYTCASLLKEPVRSKLQGLIKAYTEHRIAFVRDRPAADEQRARLAEIATQHGQMQEQVGLAVDAGTPISTPLVNTLNALTSNHAARLAAGRDRLPAAIVVLLFLASVITAYLAGTSRGPLPKWFGGSVAGFILLVAFVVWITLDLNQPNRGILLLDQEPLDRVLAGMGS